MREPVFRTPESMAAERGIDPAAWEFVREEEEDGAGRTSEASLRCERCGGAVSPDADCTVFRTPGDGPRHCWCGGCAEEADTLGAHLELLGIPFFSGRADDGERWLSMRRRDGERPKGREKERRTQ